MFEVSGGTVGKATLEIGPDEFVGVELGGVSRKIVGVDAGIAFEEFLGELGLVERAAVPEKNDPSREMPRKMSEKLPDLFALKISVGIEARVESEVPPSWRDSDGRDCRDLFPASGNNEDGSLPSLCPGPLNIGDERESALIQEYNVGLEPPGLFLYEAKRDASNIGWLAPSVPWLSSEVSGSSSPKNPSDSTNFRYKAEPGTFCTRSDQYASGSRGLSKSPLPKALLPALSSKLFSVDSTGAVDVPCWAGILSPSARVFGMPDTSAPRNLVRRRSFRPPSGMCSLVLKAGRPDTVVFRMYGDCPEVS